MRQDRSLPSYSQIFGALDFREVDEGRSVYSPAAYLAELLDLIRDTLGPDALIGADRRSDITAVPLDAEHTFTERPYLEVVNRILGTLVGPDAHATMAALRAPFTMPFSLDRERLAACLRHLRVDPVALYTLFAAGPEPDVVAREYLGLSADDAAGLTTVVTDAGELARTWYGIEGASSTDGLADVARFLWSTRLSPAQLRELLHSDAERPATGLFIHAGGPCVTVDAAGTRLLWDAGAQPKPTETSESNGTSKPIPAAWFERVNRLVRLSRLTGLSLSDTDLVLRTCCDNRLDAAALRTVAAVVYLHRTFELPADVTAALLAPVDTLGDGTGAPSLFDRLVNAAPAVPAATATTTATTAAARPAPHRWSAGSPLLTGEVLAPENRDARLRIARGLGLSEADLATAVAAVRRRTVGAGARPGPFDGADLGLPALSLLHRVAVLSRALDVSVAELFAVLDALAGDAPIGTPTGAGLISLLVTDASTADPYRMLAAPDVTTALCVVQLLAAVVPWMRRTGLDAAELAAVLGGAQHASDPSPTGGSVGGSAGDPAGTVRDLLGAALAETGLTPGTFVSDRFSARASRVVHDVLVRSAGVVSPSDSRVLQLDAECLAAAAYVGLADLPAITEEDLRGIGLAPQLAGKIFTNLVLAGYLDPAGMLVADALPEPAEEPSGIEVPAEFGVWTDFDALRERVHAVVAACLDPGSGTGGCYPSDIAALGDLDAAAQAELYDNLVVNGYLDTGGNILDPSFFADPDNAAVFALTVDLEPVAAAVLDLLLDVARRARTDKVVLDEQVLVPLAPGAEERAELLASLHFNGHLDAAGYYVDPAGLRGLGVESFPLAVRFHRRRAEILRALHRDLDVARAAALTLTPESFAEIADHAAAAAAARALTGSWLVEDLVPEEMRALVAAPDPAPSLLGAEWEQLFSAADCAALGHRIATILAEQQAYRIDVAAFADLRFDADEIPLLLDLLVAAGHLDPELTIPEDRVAWFATATNALGFTVPGLEDYSTDIFGVLHGVAGELTAALAEITATVTALAERQRAILVAALQDALGLPPDVVAAICAGVAGSEPEALELLVAPAEADARRVHDRIRRFALLAGKLGLDAAGVRVAFHDQDLAGRFAEPLVLPPGVDRVDALLERAGGERLLFRGMNWWSYAPGTATPGPARPLAECSPRFEPLAGVDAAFVDAAGTEWVVGYDDTGASRTFVRPPGTGYWTDRKQAWGAVRNAFDVPAGADSAPAEVDAAFVDDAGRVYLFRGSQYVRYTGADWSKDPYTERPYADEGYPRTVGEWWEGEDPRADGRTPVPARFQAAVDAAFSDRDGITHLFSGDRCLAVGNEATSAADVADATGATGERATAEIWGRVRNALAKGRGPDAAYAERSATVFVCGDQVLRYSDCIENPGVRADEGFPRRVESYLRDVPAGFETGLEAAFADGTDLVHLFKDGRTVALDETGARASEVPYWEETGSGFRCGEVVPTAQRWGVLGPVLAGGAVDSALLGRDGRTYLFSGDRYVRYSGTEYGLVDAGYPRTIARDWGGLRRVDASFVLDGVTYLFGTAGSTERLYVRYSTNDYTTLDTGYPKPLTDDWWNLPGDGPAGAGVDITGVDAVFTAADGRTYWFLDEHFVVFDARRRWWSDVRSLRLHWDSLPFPRVDAAFVGADGRTYVFRGTAYARYSDGDHTKLDDRYPAPVRTFWGRVANTIARSGRVDAALAVDGRTYLFAGGQCVRYDGPDALAAGTVADGYPKPLAELRAEPRFAHLPDLGGTRVEAAYADRRNVYLFADGRCHVASAALHHRYEGLGSAGVGCAFVEDGSVLVEEPGGWRRYSALEGTTVASTPVRPRTLRTVPPSFRSGLDAVLTGTDGHTYLFKGTSCYDATLQREYPLAEDWGRARNTIHDEDVVDAAFVAADGRTYVFAGDQYVVYAAPANPGAGLLDADVKSGPRSIAADWGGLAGVTLAYVHAGVTYLFERPDATGAMRCLAYRNTGAGGTDYSNPDPGYPRIVRADHWGIPAAYRSAGFVAPDAVVVEGENMFVLTQGQYVALHEPSGVWSPPRPVSRLWPGLDVADDPLDDTDTALPVTAAFTGPDGATYVFTPGAFTRHVPGGGPVTRRSIREAWGRSANNFLAPGRRVDAAFVDGEGRTFLFSGDQYTRYSGADYRYADPGYPKAVAGHLRTEEAFAGLPDAFEDAVAARRDAGAGPVVDAVVANPRTVYLFLGGDLHVVSRAAAATYDLTGLGRIRNTVADRGRVDAALVDGAGATFLFSGDQYVRYSAVGHPDHQPDRGAGGAAAVEGPPGYVDDGYPRSIETSLARDLGIAELPAELYDGIGAAFRDTAGATHLFAGPHWLRIDPTRESRLRPVAGTWGRVRNTFTDTPGGRLDAAFVAPTGELYAFRGDQYVRYRPDGTDHVEEGFPRRVKDSWGDLPPAFEKSVDAAFTLAGRIYLARGEKYVRYSDPGTAPAYRAVDRTYPQTYAARWAPGADYRLSDVLTIARFAELTRAHDGLAALLVAGPGTHPDPYAELAALTGWDAAEVRWLVRRHGFLPAAPVPDVQAGEERVEVELLLKLADAFALAAAFGAGPSTVHAEVWTRLHGAEPDLAGAAAAVAGLLERRYGPADAAVLARQMRDELNVAERDALVSVVQARSGQKSTQELFEQLLVDVDMGAQGTTSEIREAIAATQLFLHRYLLDLETVEVPGGPEAAETARRNLRTWWSWMRSYRTWEANRKVFLYPENYLRPELRPTRTPAFKALEDDLLRNEITPEAAQQAYKRYLDEYTEVSRLAIAGGYVYAAETAADPAAETRDLVLFGRTRTQPRRYYYRRARFGDEEDLTARWEPWGAVNIQINADQVYPVHAFGRVFVFWTTVESVPPPTTSSTTVSSHADGDDHEVTAPPTTEQVRVHYSFLNLNGEWVAAQTLTMDTRSEGSIFDVELDLTVSGAGGTESIGVACTYSVLPA
ncbi:MAG: hemopexin repeat-containing protein, partial [Pseudonocardia sp.]